MTGRIDVSLFGATGYGGQELLRLLAGHPRFRVVAAASRGEAGQRVEALFPHLAGFFEGLAFVPYEDAVPETCRAVFLATPNGVSKEIFQTLSERRPDLRVIDLSADFRLEDENAFREHYGEDLAHLARVGEFAYGLPETNRDEICRKSHVANPGCFATGALLALAPFAKAGLLRGDVTVAQTTGSSGSGAAAKPNTHHPERAQDMRAYQVLRHRHVPEIDRELRRMGATGFDLATIPQSGPFARGIFTAAHLRIPEKTDARDLVRRWCTTEPFLRYVEDSPALRRVARTNFCEMSVAQRGERVVVLTAIDNLGKGMSGQAIQNANLLFGLPEPTGLWTPGANP